MSGRKRGNRGGSVVFTLLLYFRGEEDKINKRKKPFFGRFWKGLSESHWDYLLWYFLGFWRILSRRATTATQNRHGKQRRRQPTKPKEGEREMRAFSFHSQSKQSPPPPLFLPLCNLRGNCRGSKGGGKKGWGKEKVEKTAKAHMEDIGWDSRFLLLIPDVPLFLKMHFTWATILRNRP